MQVCIKLERDDEWCRGVGKQASVCCRKKISSIGAFQDEEGPRPHERASSGRVFTYAHVLSCVLRRDGGYIGQRTLAMELPGTGRRGRTQRRFTDGCGEGGWLCLVVHTCAHSPSLLSHVETA